MPTTQVKNGVTYECYAWNEGKICWSDNPFTWNDVCLAIEVKKAAGGKSFDGIDTWDWNQGYEKLSKEKKKRFITLVCKIKGQSDITEKKEVENIKITSKDIELTVNTILRRPIIKVKNIK